MARKLFLVWCLAVVVNAAVMPRVEAAEPNERESGVLPAIGRSLRGEEKLTGRVVLASDPEQAVADAEVASFPFGEFQIGKSHPFIRATSDADGRFEEKLPGVKSLIGALSKDGSQGVIKNIDADQKEVTLELAPTATVRGVIWDEETDSLAANRDVAVSIRIQMGGGMSTRGFAKDAKTDDEGRFEVTGIVPGFDYQVDVVTEWRGDVPMRSRTVHTFKTDGPGEHDLKRMLLSKPYREPTLDERIATVYDVEGTPEERLEQAVLDSELNLLHVLIFAADQKSDPARQFVEMRYSFDDKHKEMYAAVAEHRVMFLDPAKADDLLKKLEIELPSDDGATLAIVDGKGDVVDVTTFDKLLTSGKIDPELLTEFLSKHRFELPNANEQLEQALQQAADEDKRVLVQVGGPGCGWCVVLARYLHEQKSLIEKDYVWLKIDSRMDESRDLIGKLRKERTGGIPWMTILDAQGDELISGDTDKEGNIGYPAEETGRQHWEKMLRTTRQRLTDDDVTALLKPLEEFDLNRKK